MEKKFTVENLVELQERLGGYFGYQLDIGYGMCGESIDLEAACQVSETITEIINNKPRKPFVFAKKDASNE